MASHGFFTYLRLKLVATLIRFVARMALAQRDRQLPGNIEPQRIRIASREKGRSINADLYYPPSTESSGPGPGKRPVLVNWHGSGFMVPGLGSDRAFCARVAREAGIIVVDADYRKAPECPFPAAVEDVEDALRWILSRPDEFDPNRVAVSGFSAGGNLALVASSSLRHDLSLAGIDISAVIAVYPPTDLSIHARAKTVPDPVKPIPGGIAALLDDCYTPDPATRKDPRVSPSLAEPSLFPNLVAIFTCQGDTLSPEANALADRLQGGKRQVVHHTLPGMPHAFDKGCEEGTPKWEQREFAYSSIIKTLKKQFPAY
ncbi:hypothetical protein JX265_000799 [Neoarthrinium moseri]|uniref:Alpha/beta hydrolase fold-3 domain-containing protein n=1 Tax=Neoarthrinium moseri TaxID=1658444 RepID=A0A9P9WWH9_9PEZI|nr:uncharacterized protein JN550_007095 [Neoarthrinium moseri]KAI1847548.1 hypothetical protein JX266_006400 [Neoarthrinium moseri]KAI1867364.1 hypothetical protein JN550_007095 [Neoarthrinium moseri]KAI1880559.1 hypothetical protein JX265_000799 [Neoarthrinium moseri]